MNKKKIEKAIREILEAIGEDPKKKDFGISGNHCRSWKFIKEELDKCALLCCRCHDEFHDGLITIHP